MRVSDSIRTEINRDPTKTAPAGKVNHQRKVDYCRRAHCIENPNLCIMRVMMAYKCTCLECRARRVP